MSAVTPDREVYVYAVFPSLNMWMGGGVLHVGDYTDIFTTMLEIMYHSQSL